MKRRTRLVAFIFSAFSLYYFATAGFLTAGLASGAILGSRPVSGNPRLLLWMWAAGLIWPFWWALLKRRPWAWWALTVLYAGGMIVEIRKLVLTPGYWLARGLTIPDMAVRTTLGLAFDLIFLLPLLFLLTDRPGGWANPQSEIRSPQ